ncbi:MAG: hypothetical protein L6V93_23065 [Clostridiales bacterium]|nr:MAG: hypothetical protein L6V93_23065 [Clostridiales bacterium]
MIEDESLAREGNKNLQYFFLCRKGFEKNFRSLMFSSESASLRKKDELFLNVIWTAKIFHSYKKIVEGLKKSGKRRRRA